MDLVRSKTGVPDVGDFVASNGSPVVIDMTAATGKIHFIDDGDNVREAGDSITNCNVSGTMTAGTVVATDNIVASSTSGEGIKIDPTSPTFPWHDILGAISIRGTGAGDPQYNVYQGGIRGYQFAVNKEVFVEFHLPHDYVPGSNLYIHAHWSLKWTTALRAATNAATGGNVVWGFEVSYAKGHNQEAFSTPITTTVQQNASTTQYQHMIAEVQLSAASPSASQLDSDLIEVDGLILVRCYLSANNVTVSAGSVPAPFLHMVDIHYQSTNIGTKDKAPPFWG